MNVVVICCDSLRPDFLSCYGNTWIRTPNLGRFAGESVVFENCICEGPPTFSTRMAWFTGKFTFPFFSTRAPARHDVMLAELLWDKQVRSAMISDGWHLHEPTGMNVGRGFDCLRWVRGQEGDPAALGEKQAFAVDDYFKPYPMHEALSEIWRKRLKQYARNTAGWKSDADTFVARVMQEAVCWLGDQDRRDGLFLWADAFDPHEPWDPRFSCHEEYDPGYRGKLIVDPVPGYVEGYLTEEELRHIRALYAGEVTLVDKWVGYLLEELRQRDIYDSSMILFTSDHGHPFGDHGIIKKSRPWPYVEMVHVPLVVRLPGGKGAGGRVKALVETVDLMPTILEFLRAPVPAGIHGRSFLPILKREAETIRRYACYGYHPWSWAIRDQEWSYIMWFGERGVYEAEVRERKPELYHVGSDAREQHNVIGEHPDKGVALELELRSFVEELRRTNPWP